jgi:phosphorylcholine metabolism protein LicD
MFWRGEKCIQHFRSQDQKERFHTEDIAINGKIRLKWFLPTRIMGYGLNDSFLG